MNNFVEARRARLAWVTIGIPAVFWWVVVLGSFLTLLLIAMLDMEIHVHLILGGVVSLYLGLAVFVIARWTIRSVAKSASGRTRSSWSTRGS